MYSGIGGADRQRTRIQCAEHHSLWHTQQLGHQPRLGYRRDTLGGHRWRDTNIEIQPQRGGGFILEKLATAGVSGAGGPGWFVPLPTPGQRLASPARFPLPPPTPAATAAD